MNVLTVHLNCPRCGGELLHEGFVPTIASPDQGWVDARCDRCCDVYRTSVSMTVVEAWPVDKLDLEARRKESATAAVNYLETSRM